VTGRSPWSAKARLTDVAARLILSSRAVDRAYRRFDGLRGRLLAAYASDAVLDRFNDLVYADTSSYRPDSPGFRAYLFPWEEWVVKTFFPAPPARVLVGGAGGGREVFPLAEMGLTVVAFEPASELAEAMARSVSSETTIAVYRGSYDDLPHLLPAAPGLGGADLEELAPFDAAVLGWGSFSHLRTHAQRVHALTCIGRVTSGPILLSLIASRRPSAAGPRAARWKRLLPPRRTGREPGDLFSVNIGFYHAFDEAELRSLAREAELGISYINFDERDTNWPHAVLAPSIGVQE
jgi:hypothetical protein